jgi:DNA-binding NarL/FixJ family response regulator
MEAPIKEIIAQYPRLAESWRLTLANVYAQTNRIEEARRELDAQAAGGFASLGRALYSLGVMALLTEAIVAVADCDAAGIVYERLRPYAGHYIVNAASPNFYGAAAHYLGMLAATLSRWDEAIGHFGAALVMNTRTGVPSHIAATQFEYAKALLNARRTTRDEDVAQALLDAALVTARELGMRRLVDQAEQLRPQQRATPPLQPALGAPRVGQLDALTPRETDVLRLLAGGLSNREIAAALVVTVNTVERHLVSIYSKLQVRGRAAATAYALRRGLISEP